MTKDELDNIDAGHTILMMRGMLASMPEKEQQRVKEGDDYGAPMYRFTHLGLDALERHNEQVTA